MIKSLSAAEAQASAVLVINAGSSSIKFALIACDSPQPIVRGEIERLGSTEATLNWRIAEDSKPKKPWRKLHMSRALPPLWTA